MYRIPLRVDNIDLEDDETLAVLGEHLSDLSWAEFEGAVVAVLHTTAASPVGDAIQAARRINHALPDAEVVEVDQDLVTVSDIAHRVGVSREAVRLWIEGRRGPGDFPKHSGAVSGGKSKVWQWASVNEWLREHYHLGDEEDHLNRSQVAEVNVALLRVKQHIDNEWETVSSYGQRLVQSEVSDEALGVAAVFADKAIATAAKGHMSWALHMVDRSGWVKHQERASGFTHFRATVHSSAKEQP